MICNYPIPRFLLITCKMWESTIQLIKYKPDRDSDGQKRGGAHDHYFCAMIHAVNKLT